MTPIFRWRVYLSLLVGEFLALAMFVLFGLSLLDLLMPDHARVKVISAWLMLTKSRPHLFLILSGTGLGLFFLLELLRLWLTRVWAADLEIGENL